MSVLNGGKSLEELFSDLQAPVDTASDSNRFMAIPIGSSGTYRLGKDVNSAPALLIKAGSSKATYGAPIRLRHLHVAHDVNCVIHRDETTEAGRFSVFACVEADRETETYFLRVAETLVPTLGEHPDANSINKAVDQLVELFQALRSPPVKVAQGLWAELLLLAESEDPGKLVDSWHSVREDLYDFNEGSHRIEVKSASGEARKHSFSLAQLQPPVGTHLVVASVIVNRAGGGSTINDLVDELRYRLSESPERQLRIYRVVTLTLGDRWRESSQERFDRPAAKSSLSFFRPSDIPMVNPDLPPGVTNVRFSADLTGKVPYTEQEIRALGGIIASAVTRRGQGIPRIQATHRV